MSAPKEIAERLREHEQKREVMAVNGRLAGLSTMTADEIRDVLGSQTERISVDPTTGNVSSSDSSKPERKYITDAAWERWKRRWSGNTRASYEELNREAGVLTVTVEEWDERCAPAGPYTPLNPAPGSYLDIMQQRDEARSERDALRAEIARLRNAPPFPPEIERLRELVAEAQASAERMRSAYEMAHAQAMANGTRASRAEAEADRLRRVLHAERQPEVQTKPAFRWSPML